MSKERMQKNAAVMKSAAPGVVYSIKGDFRFAHTRLVLKQPRFVRTVGIHSQPYVSHLHHQQALPSYRMPPRTTGCHTPLAMEPKLMATLALLTSVVAKGPYASAAGEALASS